MEMKDYLTRVLRQERLSREETKDILTGIPPSRLRPSLPPFRCAE